jgi:hypothetical protein
MKKHKHVETVERHRHDNGRFCDHAQLQCPCGRLLVVPIDDCPECGPAIAAHTIDDEVLCDDCGGLFCIETKLAVHCAQQYSESCAPSEGDED